jgi:uncharacterized membrane protein YphA (DoxX/SURF4 family)
MTITGWVLTVLPACFLIFGAVQTFHPKPEMVQGFTGKYGYPASVLPVLGVLEIVGALLFLIPQTAALGAVFLTGYLGGATATHVRVGEAPLPPIVFGVIVWAALFCRDVRIRHLLPLRR